MDKYEFNIKVEQIKKLVNKGDYETAMKIADTIDWRRVRSTSLLTMVAQVYERNEEYQDARDILLLAFERAPSGKGLLFKLTDLALREGDIQEAEAYYREFCDLTGDDPRQNLLRYLILDAKEAPVEQKINSLERYCLEELDEKWMYHLAELYKEAERENDCVKMCDKIMLLFGLGKYVDKAMELKQEFAPLSKYQRDLVDNREKYEEKLRAVEEEYSGRSYTAYTNEEDFLDSEEEETEEEELSSATPAGKERMTIMDEELEASLHEAAAEEELAREVSQLTPYEETASANEETRVFRKIVSVKEEELPQEEEPVVEDWDLEDDEEPETLKNHLMIESLDQEKGLALALDSLKKIHQELGSKNPVAKISGEKLSQKGVFAVSDRLAGKDLLVERAADLDDTAIYELVDLMMRDETGIIVVLIDTPLRMEQLHRNYPALADMFQYIGCNEEDAQALAALRAEEEERQRLAAEREAEAARKRLAEREEEIRRQAAKDAEEARRLQAIREEEARRQAELAAEEARRREEEERYRAELAAEEARRQAEYEAAEAARYQAELAAEEARRQAEYEAAEAARYEAELAAEEEARRQAEYEAGREYSEEDGRYEDEQYEDDGYEDDEYEEYEEDAREDEDKEDGYAVREVDDSELDVEEFVQYACKYAAEIDCSISGKSMLALYERAEMMEEDGEALTRISAEDLIEEAADKAEKKSFGGLFSSKYDKDGLLILKEKHFFD